MVVTCYGWAGCSRQTHLGGRRQTLDRIVFLVRCTTLRCLRHNSEPEGPGIQDIVSIVLSPNESRGSGLENRMLFCRENGYSQVELVGRLNERVGTKLRREANTL